MPLPARGHRLGESSCQTVGLRAITDKRQERSPFFFDRHELLDGVVALERFDARAERVTGRDGFGAEPRLFGGFLDPRSRRAIVAWTFVTPCAKRSIAAASVAPSACHASDRRASSARSSVTSAASVDS